MKRTPLHRTTELSRTTPIKPRNGRRTAKESERVYGPPARREWLTRQSCVCCGRIGTADYPNHQHHTENGGMSRKADADTLVSLCPPCHRLVHDGNGPDLDWKELARKTEEAWQNAGR